MRKRHGHHGGAWKVAYADFITAMMALFLVLWLTAQDRKIREAVERAFRNPFMSVTKESTGVLPSENAQAMRSREGNFDSASAVELNMLRRLNQELLHSLQGAAEENNESVKLDLRPDGLNITVFDRTRKPIFEPDSAIFTEYGNWVFATLAWVVARQAACQIELEGHTERGHAGLRPDYGVWELSTDRANASRRKLITHGVQTSQVYKVAGYADTIPLPALAPEDESNRRVTVLLKIKSQPPS